MDVEQRIRELCTKAIRTEDTEQFEQVLAELKLALHEHTEQTRKKVRDSDARRSRRKLQSDKSSP